jgi:DNA-binding NarL/FixJ family response regulator
MLQKWDGNSAVAMSSDPESEVTSSKQNLRIVLVDDHVELRRGLASLLRAEQDIKIVGEAWNGESAVNLIREIQPDVVLMDISMPGMNGIQATGIIHSELPEVRIIGLSMSQEEAQAAAMREAGAVDYVSKSEPSEAVIAAIRACA